MKCARSNSWLIRGFLAGSVVLCGCAAVRPWSPSATELSVKFQDAPRSTFDSDVSTTSRAIHSYLLGRLSYGEERFEDALEYYRQATELADIPESDVYIQLAELSLLSGNAELAYQQISRAKPEAGDNDAVRVALLQAGILEVLNRDQEAVPYFESALKQEPTRTDAAIPLAALYARGADPKRAEQTIRPIAKQKDLAFIAEYYLGRFSEQQGKFAEAVAHFNKALAIEPANPAVLLNLTRALIKSGKIKTADEVITKALKADPEYRLAASLQLRIRRGSEAIAEDLKNPEIFGTPEEDWLATRFKLALLLIEQRHFGDARRELGLILSRDPQNSEARYYLASLYAGTGMRRQAVAELLKIESSADLFIKSRTFAGFILRQEGDLARAEDVVREAFEQDRSDHNVLSYLVLILRDAGKFKEARNLLAEAIESDPNDDRLLFHYGVVLGDLGDEPEALEAMERVIAVNPEHSDALNYLAYALAEKGVELPRALELAQRALLIRPNDGYYLDTVGWIHFQQKDFERAEELLGRAVRLTGNDVVIQEHYGDALRALSQQERALEVYRGALERARDETNPSPEIRDAVGRLQEKVEALEAVVRQKAENRS